LKGFKQMSHMVETMAYSGEVPWHGLGNPVEYGVSSEVFLKSAGLDTVVEKRPLLYRDKLGNLVDSKKCALVRVEDDKFFDVVGKDWKPVQNREIFDFMKDFVQAGGITLETAGALYGGRVIWGLAKLNHTFEVSSGDKVEGYLLTTSHHELGVSTSVKTTTVRVVCANTMAQANRDGNTETNYRQSHHKQFDIEAAQEAVANAHENMIQAAANAKTLRKLKLSVEDAMKKVIAPLWNPENKIDDEEPKAMRQIRAALMGAPGAEPGNGWGAMNAVTFYSDHLAGATPVHRLANSWLGSNASKKQKVQKLLLDMAQ
jgi:phage/plasmid-like protein (TIGR03299 family)